MRAEVQRPKSDAGRGPAPQERASPASIAGTEASAFIQPAASPQSTRRRQPLFALDAQGVRDAAPIERVFNVTCATTLEAPEEVSDAARREPNQLLPGRTRL